MTRLNPQTLAGKARQRLGVGLDLPLCNLFTLLRQDGLHVIRYPFSFEGSTAAVLCRKGKEFFAAIDSSKALGNQYFSAAHEFGHYLAHQDRLYFACGPVEPGSPESNELERFANVFAAELLLPRTAAEAWLERNALNPSAPSLHEVVRLQQTYCLSYSAALYRLANLGIIRPEQRDEWLAESPSALARRWGLPGSLYVPDYATDIPPDYVARWVDAYEAGKVSFKRLRLALERVKVSAESLQLRHPVAVDDVI